MDVLLRRCKPASRSNSERFHGSLPLLVLTFVLGIPTTDRCRPAPVSSSRIAKGQTETDALPVSVSVSDPPISKSMSDRQAQKGGARFDCPGVFGLLYPSFSA
jgi:hypothetical protein